MDPPVLSLASVVSWLESIAEDDAGLQLHQQVAPRFADHDGVWIETRQLTGGQSEKGFLHSGSMNMMMG